MLKKRGLLTLPVLLIAIMALALGSVGTATAGGLTAHAVKKIAAKVVKKKAKTLTVANATHATTATSATSATTAGSAATATTAGNANTLAGQPPSAYQNQTYVFTTDVAAGTSSVTIPITPPAGNYLINYSAFLSLDNDTDGQVDCYVERGQGATSTYFGESYYYTNEANGGSSGSGFTSVGNGVTAFLDCSASDTFGTFSDEPIQITATRVDNVSSSSVAPMLRPATAKQQRH